jgi:uncharacterized membrane protein YkvA (DUF1232 family)
MNIRTVITSILAAAYAVSPLDVVPDVLFGIGWLDDTIVLVLAFLYLRRIWNERRNRPASQVTIDVTPEIPQRRGV